MTQKPKGWHKITIEWSDGMVATNTSLETDFGSESMGVAASIGLTLACVLSNAGFNPIDVLIHAMTNTESEDIDRDKLILAAHRLVSHECEDDA